MFGALQKLHPGGLDLEEEVRLWKLADSEKSVAKSGFADFASLAHNPANSDPTDWCQDRSCVWDPVKHIIEAAAEQPYWKPLPLQLHADET